MLRGASFARWAQARWLGPLIVTLLAVVAYANALGGAFHFDDAHAVAQNPAIRSLSNLGRFFTDVTTFSVLAHNLNYRPVLLASFALNAQVMGVQAPAFLVGNLLVHVACALLLLLLVRTLAQRLGRDDAGPLAFVAAALFAVHPLFSECVNYVSARSESLSAALSLAALYAWLRGRDDRRWLAAAAVAGLAAVLTKAVAVTVPAFAALVLWLIPAERARGAKKALLDWAFLALPIALGTWLVLHLTPAFAKASGQGFSRGVYLRSEIPATLHYLRLFLWPLGQSADPSYPAAPSLLAPSVWLPAIVLLMVTGWLGWALVTRRQPGVALCLSWFLLSLAPTALFPLAEIVNEHRPYLAGAALCVLAGAAIRAARQTLLNGADPLARRAGGFLTAGVLCLLIALTVTRNRVWHDEERLWSDIVTQAPLSARAQMNYGLALMRRGRMTDAGLHLTEAVRLAPRYPYARINYGNWLLAQDRRGEAARQLDLALALDSKLFYGPYYRGLAAERLLEAPERREHYFRQAVALGPAFADGWYHLALARDAARDLPGTVEAAAQAVALRGSYDDRFLYGYALLKVRQARTAMPILTALAHEHPDDSRVTANVAYARGMLE